MPRSTRCWLGARRKPYDRTFDDFLKNHNVILEHRVMERTASLAAVNETLRANNEQIQRYIEQLKAAFMSSVEVATIISGMRDSYTAGHARRVADIAAAIGAELSFDAQRQEGLRVAGLLHDIGKIKVPAEILTKPGKLSPIQFQLIHGHAQTGYDVLKDVEFPWPVAEVECGSGIVYDATVADACLKLFRDQRYLIPA